MEPKRPTEARRGRSFRLTGQEFFGLLRPMRRLARQFLRIVWVAVAVGAASLNGYAAVLASFDGPAHAGHAHGHHHHHDHGTPSGGGHAGADPAPSGDEPASADHTCGHMHAHCCSVVALPAAECGLRLGHLTRPVVHRVTAHMPPGEGTSSLFRPPRAAV